MRGRIERRTHYRVEEVPTQGQERGLSITGRWIGVEVRPTRVFMWLGSRSQGHERVLPTGLEPRPLRSARRRRHLTVGTCHVAFLGNPALTLGLLGLNVARRAVFSTLELRGAPRPPGPEKG